MRNARGLPGRFFWDFTICQVYKSPRKDYLNEMSPRTKNTKPEDPIDPFSELTWDDLEDWAGNRIVARGRSYQRRGAVRDLQRDEEGALVAWGCGQSPLRHKGEHRRRQGPDVRMHLSILDDVQTRGGRRGGIPGDDEKGDRRRSG